MLESDKDTLSKSIPQMAGVIHHYKNCETLNQEIRVVANSIRQLRDRIVSDPAIMAGKPVVRGTRIPVDRVLQHLEEHDRADVFEAFPELTDAYIRACLAFARSLIETPHKAAS